MLAERIHDHVQAFDSTEEADHLLWVLQYVMGMLGIRRGGLRVRVTWIQCTDPFGQVM